MNRDLRTPNEVREVGIHVLMKAMGPVNTIRFLQQFEPGYGDYTAERHKFIDNSTIAELIREIKAFQRSRKRKMG